MKPLPKCSMEVHTYLALLRKEKKDKEEAARLKKIADLNKLLADIAQAFKVDIDLIKSGDQQSLIVTVRKIFYYIGHFKMGATYESMVQIVGKTNHTSCLYHIRRVHVWLKAKDKKFIPIWNHYLENSNIYTKKDFQ
jgi:chromosomal replication initiation ATPase DnaA